jgi:hypothetical protein
MLAAARWLLSERDPTPAARRRAVSTAYYALFHACIQLASRRFSNDPDHRLLIYRGFAHTGLLAVCRHFEDPQKAHPELRALIENNTPEGLQAAAKTFRRLQEARHRADYDPTIGGLPSTMEALERIVDSETAIHYLRNSESVPSTVLFLTCLLQSAELFKKR